MVKSSLANAGDVGSISGLGRSPGEGSGNPLQYSHLGNLMDRGAWWATVHGIVRVRHELATKHTLTPWVGLRKMTVSNLEGEISLSEALGPL